MLDRSDLLVGRLCCDFWHMPTTHSVMVFIRTSLNARVGVCIVDWTAYDLIEPCKFMAIVRGNGFEVITLLKFNQPIIERLFFFTINQATDPRAVFSPCERQKHRVLRPRKKDSVNLVMPHFQAMVNSLRPY